jgi:hypothetical protein
LTHEIVTGSVIFYSFRNVQVLKLLNSVGELFAKREQLDEFWVSSGKNGEELGGKWGSFHVGHILYELWDQKTMDAPPDEGEQKKRDKRSKHTCGQFLSQACLERR